LIGVVGFWGMAQKIILISEQPQLKALRPERPRGGRKPIAAGVKRPARFYCLGWERLFFVLSSPGISHLAAGSAGFLVMNLYDMTFRLPQADWFKFKT